MQIAREKYTKTARQVEVLDDAWLARARRDFSALVEGADQATTEAQVNTYFDGLERFRERFHQAVIEKFVDVNDDTEDRARADAKRRIDDPSFALYMALSPPVIREDAGANLLPLWKKAKSRWSKRLRDAGTAFWSAVSTMSRYTHDLVPHTEDIAEIEGFKAKFISYSETDSEALGIIRYALRKFRANANRYMPWLLKNMRPINIRFKAVETDALATYLHGVLTLYVQNIDKDDPDFIAMTIAHEMGHHLWNLISASAQKFWRTAWRDDHTDINIEDVLRDWPESIEDTHKYGRSLAESDPVRAVQLMALAYRDNITDYTTRQNFEDRLASGKTTVRVPKSPITDYGDTNAVEAFCEAIGLFVGYGPRAVHELVRAWLDIILPNEVHVARTANRSIEEILDDLKSLTGGEEPSPPADEDIEDEDDAPFEDSEENSRAQSGPWRERYRKHKSRTPTNSTENGADDESDKRDLDTDFDWDFYDQMYPSVRHWPVQDNGSTYAPSSISRYNVDFFRLVARVKRVAKLLNSLT